jgi:Alkaline and neutral invertase
LIAVERTRRGAAVADGRWQRAVDLALQWLHAQEHQRFFLLQQNEASDWADIMPRSGFVLYTNALWYRVKSLYGLARQEETKHHFNHLFHPYRADLPEYRRGRLLRHYAVRSQRKNALYLSFVNFSFAGTEGDVFGNLLAILCGLASDARAHEIVRALRAAAVADPYPIRVVIDPVLPGQALWRAYMARHQQNRPHQYHNGGIWPFVGGFWVLLANRLGMRELARRELVKLAQANALGDWRFTEWLHGRTLLPMGMPGQAWNAATFLLARRALEGGAAAF